MKLPLTLMFILIALMFVVAFICRMWAVKFGLVKLADYETFKGAAGPEYVVKTSNNLNNLLQLPPLFVAACVLAVGLDYISESLIFNAWGFVVSRYVHTLVHITVNHVLMRSLAFGIGIYFLVVMWFELLSKI